MPYVEVVFNLPIYHAFTYHIPETFSYISPGYRVLVPFGKRTLTGIVVNVLEKTSYSSVKPILDVLDDKPLVRPDTMALARWISAYYMAPLGQTLQLAIPKGLEAHDQENLFLVEEDPGVSLPERQKELYMLIGENPGKSKSYYRKKMGTGSFYAVLRALEKKGLVYSVEEHKNARVSALIRKCVSIPGDLEELIEKDEHFKRYLEKKPHVASFLKQHKNEDILVSDFLKETRMARATLHKMAGNKLVMLVDKVIERKPEINYHEEEKEIFLTAQQKNVIGAVCRGLEAEEYRSFLLYGITGSGKTVVYIEILKRVLAAGRKAIILIPEIALTPQTVSRFQKAFDRNIAIFHSKMSVGERFDAWQACYSGQVSIVIGPRSALFAPMENIGLIVVDEEHEQSYKQTDSVPGYNARDVALYLGRMHKAHVVLGSATPSFESFYNARRGKHVLLKMMERANKMPLPTIHLVDMRKEKSAKGRPVFSRFLLEQMDIRITRGEQVILLQNRRGYASFQQCLNCGFIVKCAECDVTLTYHSYDHSLRCHYCGFKTPASAHCPNCGSKDIEYKGAGTQQLQQELERIYPGMPVLRMDQDTTRGKNSYERILDAFRQGRAPVLLGTQMISKGLDFPNVTLVGVISADVGLAVPDFRSSEKVFQLLAQVAGRSGRAEKEGEVVVQSFQTDHYAIQFARTHNYEGFYEEEIKHRENYKYPPFYRLIVVTVSAADFKDAINISRQIGIPLRRHLKPYAGVIGPAPAALSRLRNMYRWQITIKIDPAQDVSGKRTKRILHDVVQSYRDKKHAHVNISIDVDPLFAV